jgi:hypothetical protein
MSRKKAIAYQITASGCWECTSHSKNKDGYPRCWRNGKYYILSRYIYEQTFGEIPKNLIVRHKCDNPSCINPDHLEIGTIKDNAIDRNSRGRAASTAGSNNGFAKLDEYAVSEILNHLSKGEKINDIAKLFNVSCFCISDIASNKRWKHIPRTDV